MTAFKFWLIVSFVLHVSAGWLMYVKLALPPRIRNEIIRVDLVSLPVPVRPEPPAQVEESKESEQPEPVEPPKPKPPEPEPEPKRRSASELRKKLAELARKRRKDREREPTPTPLRVAQVPTVAPARRQPSRPSPVVSQRQTNPNQLRVSVGAGVQGRYDYYLNAIRNALWMNWKVPRIPGVERLSTEARLRISRDGRVLSKRIVKKSGNSSFDRSVEEAIEGAEFPPFPDDKDEQSLDVIVLFRPVGD